MSWKPTHTFDGVPCFKASTNESDRREGLVAVCWSGDSPVANRIPLGLWDRHAKPIIGVGTATFPWVSVEDVPHPIDGTEFLALQRNGTIVHVEANYRDAGFTHWCRLPEVTP